MSPTNVADKPLFRDPVFDGATDPVVCWNRAEKQWVMFYTNRRANVEDAPGVTWVHGSEIGMAESPDGVSWKYRGTARIHYAEDREHTYWAPDVICHADVYHMYLTYVPGIFETWDHPRDILHLTSQDMLDWEYQSTLNLSSGRTIDASVWPLPDGGWRLWYNNEEDRKSIYFADSPDLYHWTDRGKAVDDQQGEGPAVFAWQGRYWMITDVWDGLGVYQSDDLLTWIRQPGNLLQTPGKGPDDQGKGHHASVVVSGDRAYLFYFTHPGRHQQMPGQSDAHAQRRSSIQVAELEIHHGLLSCDRDRPVQIQLLPPAD
ncbi:family 43 glycosylhydrolase [Candidatus Sumerlaeota bacterium]|nr:family 43 glycosylhydrolase [Candidatus Sumerlaeota bacterium]